MMCMKIYEIWNAKKRNQTAASGMAGLGTPPHVIERILNHSSGIISGVAAVYNRYDYKDEMKRSLDAWGLKIINILSNN